MSPGLRIEKLRRDHAVEGFDCGKDALNRFLTRHALQSQQAGATTTYLALHGDDVVGFYSLSVGHVEYADAPERLVKGLARHPVPIMLLARMAVASAYQGQKLGAGLLKDAMLRTLQASEIAGIRAFVVHAKDDEARAFYERFDFIASPTDAYHLALMMKDVRALLSPK
jgi:GNAT superfamily N-acetyltransferase